MRDAAVKQDPVATGCLSRHDHPDQRRGPVALCRLLGATACLLALCAGCRKEVSTGGLDVTTAESSLPQQDHFSIAIDYLKMRDKHNPERSASQAIYQLNRWIRQETADPDWITRFVDRQLINTLPDTIRRCESAKEMLSDKALAQLEFASSDVLMLEETRWLRAIATTVEQAPADPVLDQWIRAAGFPPKAARDLARSQALFDWVIRNIQLDELLEYPRTTAAGPLAEPNNVDPSANWPPPMLALPGPGYSGQVWHVLMYGRGDAYQRARVFLLLLRQLRIDAAMLGIDTKVGRARPWLPAVRIDSELYLFDTALGLPIAGPQGQGIATLSQAIKDPAILKTLDIGGNYVYPVSQADLDKVVAMIDAAPEYLSQRMVLVEKQLSAADQMILTVSLPDLARDLRACPGVTDVRLWAVPLEASIYQKAYAVELARNPQAQWNEYVQHGVFQELVPLVKGRRCYLLGQFNKRGDEEGAAGHFRDARMTDATMEELGVSRRVQTSMGLERPLGMSDEDWNNRLEQVKRLQQVSKEHASYWTGLSHQQQGNQEVAINWLLTRTLEKSPDGPWTHGARYNLARCYEALGKTDEAIQLYRIDESPQRHGNLLRAQRLESRAAEAKSS